MDTQEMRGSMERMTAAYIRKERDYIFRNLLLSAALIAIAVMNMVGIFIMEMRERDHFLLPPLLLLVILVIALVYYKRLFQAWDRRLAQVMDGDSIAEGVSHTGLLYELVDFVENRKWWFYLIYLGFVPYLVAGLRLLLMEDFFRARPLFFDLMIVGQAIILAGAAVYLLVQVHHDLRWKRKLKRLEELERTINEEIGMVDD